MIFSGYIFDIEGTLIDCVPQTLSSLHDTLKEWGRPVPYETLQLYSGLDGDETLTIVAPSLTSDERKSLLEADGKHYEKVYLPTVRAFEGVRELFTAIKAGDGRIAIATDCKGSPLKVYRSLLDVDDLVDHIACGDDVEKGKPDPALVHLAVEKLGLPAGRCVMIGDTPYDCEAAVRAGATAIGLLSGGFASEALFKASAIDVRGRIDELRSLLSGNETAGQ
jgi:phosphoglycolate phosphatase-like HAD superfamily hydrolase